MGEVKRSSVYLVGTVAALLSGAGIAWLIRGTTGVHLPLLGAAVGGILIGLIDSRKGWIPAIIQSVVLVACVFLPGRSVPEIEYHSVIGSVGLTLAGSFIGAFVKRAYDS